ncbi:50S ribosomal protein L11 [Candidatus Bipolaricaulota bacterium]|nr:50S ribosomal protein L11 [Candidatus Bipolaricaulota bacterium]
MAKRVETTLKLQIPAGQADPSPPVGPALGEHKVNIMDFCNKFNSETGDKEPGVLIPVDITIYTDKSFTFVAKEPPASELIKKAAGISSGSGQPNMEKVGKITEEQLERIAETKLPDLNTYKMESAKNIIGGTARNMGVEVVES